MLAPAGIRAAPCAAWDVILVNILPHIIISLLEAGLHTYLAPGGRMICAGIIEAREPEVVAALAGTAWRWSAGWAWATGCVGGRRGAEAI